MASPTQWTWVWVDYGSWWWTGRPGDVYFLLGKLMDNTIQLTNIDIEHFSFNSRPSITVEYRKTQPCNLGLLYNGGNVDICSHDDTLDYLKREMKKQFTEELERAKIKEETVLEFKEISW